MPWPERIERKLEQMALDISALSAAVDSLVAVDTGVVAALDDLKAKLDDGNTITQADLDLLKGKVTGAVTDIQAAIDRDDPASPPAAPADGTDAGTTPDDGSAPAGV